MPTIVIGAGPPRGNARYWHVVQAGFGVNPPADPNSTVTGPGILNLGGWTTLSGADPDGANGIINYSGTRTCKNKSSGETEPGPATIILLGDNGWLDPSNPTSPYYGYLVEGVPIRVLLTDGTTFWDDWRGFVLRWPISESNKRGQAAVIDAYDAIGWLGGRNSPYPSDLHRAILQTGPSSYWPHDDPSGSVSIRDVVSGFDAQLLNGASPGGPSLTPEGAGGSVDFASTKTDPAGGPPGNGGPIVRPFPAAIPAPPFTVLFVLKILAAPTPSTIPGDYQFQDLLEANGTSDRTQPRLRITTFGAAVYDAPGGGGGFASTYVNWDGSIPSALGAPLPVGGPYVIAVTYDLTGKLSFWIDGILVNSNTAPLRASTGAGVATLCWGNPFANVVVYDSTGVPTGPGPGWGTEKAHMTFWPRVVTGTEMAAVSLAALNARRGDTVDQRLNYLADLARWPPGKRRFQISSQLLGPVRMAGATQLDLWKRAVAFEDGILAADAAGNLVFESRYGAPAQSFAVGGPLAPKQGATYGTVDTTAITTATVSDPPVQFDSGNTGTVSGRAVKLDQLAHSADDAWLTAQRLVQLGEIPARPGIDSVTLDPIDVPAALTLDQCAVGTVTRRPIWSGSDLLERYQVTAVTSTGGGGKPAKRQFSMLQPRAAQLYLSCNLAVPTGALAAYLSRYNPGADLVVEAQIRASDWFLSTTQAVVSHGDTSGGWSFYLTANGLGFIWVDNALGLHAFTSFPVVRTGSRWLWVRAIFSATVGGVAFYVSQDNRSNYTPWGGGSIGGATTVHASTDGIHLGEAGGGAGGTQLFGDILKVVVSTFAGAPIATFDPTADAQPTGLVVPRSWTSSTGEAWTIQPNSSLQFA